MFRIPTEEFAFLGIMLSELSPDYSQMICIFLCLSGCSIHAQICTWKFIHLMWQQRKLYGILFVTVEVLNSISGHQILEDKGKAGSFLDDTEFDFWTSNYRGKRKGSECSYRL